MEVSGTNPGEPYTRPPAVLHLNNQLSSCESYEWLEFEWLLCLFLCDGV